MVRCDRKPTLGAVTTLVLLLTVTNATRFASAASCSPPSRPFVRVPLNVPYSLNISYQEADGGAASAVFCPVNPASGASLRSLLDAFNVTAQCFVSPVEPVTVATTGNRFTFTSSVAVTRDIAVTCMSSAGQRVNSEVLTFDFYHQAPACMPTDPIPVADLRDVNVVIPWVTTQDNVNLIFSFRRGDADVPVPSGIEPSAWAQLLSLRRLRACYYDPSVAINEDFNCSSSQDITDLLLFNQSVWRPMMSLGDRSTSFLGIQVEFDTMNATADQLDSFNATFRNVSSGTPLLQLKYRATDASNSSCNGSAVVVKDTLAPPVIVGAGEMQNRTVFNVHPNLGGVVIAFLGQTPLKANVTFRVVNAPDPRCVLLCRPKATSELMQQVRSTPAESSVVIALDDSKSECDELPPLVQGEAIPPDGFGRRRALLLVKAASDAAYNRTLCGVTHTLAVRAFDGMRLSDTLTMYFGVENLTCAPPNAATVQTARPITTFAGVLESDTFTLADTLLSAGNQIVNPSSWAVQLWSLSPPGTKLLSVEDPKVVAPVRQDSATGYLSLPTGMPVTPITMLKVRIPPNSNATLSAPAATMSFSFVKQSINIVTAPSVTCNMAVFRAVEENTMSPTSTLPAASTTQPVSASSGSSNGPPPATTTAAPSTTTHPPPPGTSSSSGPAPSSTTDLPVTPPASTNGTTATPDAPSTDAPSTAGSPSSSADSMSMTVPILFLLLVVAFACYQFRGMIMYGWDTKIAPHLPAAWQRHRHRVAVASEEADGGENDDDNDEDDRAINCPSAGASDSPGRAAASAHSRAADTSSGTAGGHHHEMATVRTLGDKKSLLPKKKLKADDEVDQRPRPSGGKLGATAVVRPSAAQAPSGNATTGWEVDDEEWR